MVTSVVLLPPVFVVGLAAQAPAASGTGGPTWTQVSKAGAPPPVGQGAVHVVYDGATGQLLAYDTGPVACSPLGPMWVWDGESWSHLPAAAPLSGLTDPVLAYDAASQQLLLFGGYRFSCAGQGAAAGDVAGTWAWNGSRWTQLHPAMSPPAGSAGCAGYDPTTKEVVAYGFGADQGLNFIADPNTWTWDGSTWTAHLVSPAPGAPSIDCQMAFDPVGGRLLLTVTQAPGNGGIDTWSWDGATWVEQAGSGPPGASSSAPTMADDVALGRVLLYYGVEACSLPASPQCTPGQQLSQTWEWSGASWVQDTPSNTPSPRVDTVVGYDDATAQLVLFGGYTSTSSTWASDTWTYAVSGSSAITPQRIAGADRDETAARVAAATFPPAGAPGGTAASAVLARDDSFADALVGGPLAVAQRGPLLLTPPSGLAAVTAQELSRELRPGSTVYLLGGTAALSATVAAQVSSLGFNVVRVAGNDRYATAVAVADALGDPGTVFEASGLNYPDALSAAPAAALAHGAILLTAGNAQTQDTAAYLSAYPGTRYAIGGPAAVADPNATALVGADRYATNAAIARAFFPGAVAFIAATGTNFPDALAAGAYGGNIQGGLPLLLLASTGSLPTPIHAYLATHAADVLGLDVIGGPTAVSQSVVEALATALQGG